jgi:hypothetical protein
MNPAVDSSASLRCDFRLLVIPNLKKYWNSRDIKYQITWAKEKLSFESAKGMEGGWKDLALKGKKGLVTRFTAILGMQTMSLKKAYEAHLSEKLLVANDKDKCDMAKCISFCSSECESQCDDMDSTDESFLKGVSWTKDMCDVDGSKTLIKEKCNGLKEEISDCDANCDSSSVIPYFAAMMLAPLSAMI